MKNVKGYNFSRPFFGERVPQHVQNIVIKDFCNKNILHKSKGSVKLLNVGELKTPINIEISFASKKAVEQIKAAGGNIKTTENN